MARHFNRPRVHRSNIPGRVRETIWSGTGPVQVTEVAGGASILTSLAAGGLALRPFTVVRTRGVMFIRSDIEAADEQQWMSYGSCVVSDQASAIGVTAVPTPVTDMSSDLWFLYESIVNSFTFVSATGFDGSSGKMIQYDSKAMRKVQEGEDLITVDELAASTISEGAVFSVTERQLFKLH